MTGVGTVQSLCGATLGYLNLDIDVKIGVISRLEMGSSDDDLTPFFIARRSSCQMIKVKGRGRDRRAGFLRNRAKDAYLKTPSSRRQGSPRTPFTGRGPCQNRESPVFRSRLLKSQPPPVRGNSLELGIDNSRLDQTFMAFQAFACEMQW